MNRMPTFSIEQTVASNIRRMRDETNVSLSELARRSGIGKATLSALESGAGNPTIQTLSALAAALGCSLGDLIADRTPQVLRDGEGTWVEDRSLRGRLVARLFGQQGVDVHDVFFRPGAVLEAAPLRGTTEHLFVLSGALKAEQGESSYELAPGDCLRLSDQAYRLEARDGEVRGLFFIGSGNDRPRTLQSDRAPRRRRAARAARRA